MRRDKNRGYYSLDENLNCVEHGEVSIEEAYNLIDKYIEGQEELKGIKNGEYLISKSSFGFTAEENISIEIFIYDKYKFGVQFEMATPKKVLFIKYNSWYQEEITIFSIEELKEITGKFFEYESEEFKNYFEIVRKKL